GEVADRRLAARAIGRAAIAGARAPRPAVGLAVSAGPVPRRVAALLARPRAVTRAAAGAAALLLAVPAASVASALDAAHDLHQQVELAQR
ncbi:M56 family peptidase, partial [Streptacidiphilus monticola]